MNLALLTKAQTLDDRFENKEGIDIVYKLKVGENVFRQGGYGEVITEKEPDAILINRYIDSTEDMTGLIELLNFFREELRHVKPLILVGDDKEEDIKILAANGYFNVLRRSEAKSTKMILHKLEKPQAIYEEKEEDVSEEKAPPILQINVGTTKTEYRSKQVIAVTSPPLSQGGATFMVINLAKTLKKEKHLKTCIVEWDTYKPLLKRELKAKPQKTMRDAVKEFNMKTLRPEKLEEFIESTSGIDVLFASPYRTDFTQTDDKFFKEVIKMLKLSYDIILIDTNSCYDVKTTQIALEISDRAFFVTRATEFDLSYINYLIKDFQRHDDFDTRKIEVIINDYAGFDLTSIETESLLVQMPLGYIDRQKSGLLEKLNTKKFEKALKELVLK